MPLFHRSLSETRVKREGRLCHLAALRKPSLTEINAALRGTLYTANIVCFGENTATEKRLLLMSHPKNLDLMKPTNCVSILITNTVKRGSYVAARGCGHDDVIRAVACVRDNRIHRSRIVWVGIDTVWTGKNISWLMFTDW